MIIYFAGAGYKVENSEKIKKEDNDQWGVLLSYKDQKTKDGNGSKRFQKLHQLNEKGLSKKQR